MTHGWIFQRNEQTSYSIHLTVRQILRKFAMRSLMPGHAPENPQTMLHLTVSSRPSACRTQTPKIQNNTMQKNATSTSIKNYSQQTMNFIKD